MIKTFSIYVEICGALNVLNIDCTMKHPNCLSPVVLHNGRKNEDSTSHSYRQNGGINAELRKEHSHFSSSGCVYINNAYKHY